jgi:multimeric flavodoxin WrbA
MIGKGLKKILVLNASPKCEASATLTVTKAFVEGLKEILECEIEYINISKLNIKPCLGCLSCWGRTAGECVIKDDDALIMKKKIDEADIVIEIPKRYYENKHKEFPHLSFDECEYLWSGSAFYEK